MDMKCHPGGGLMDPLPLPQSAPGVAEPWYCGGVEPTGRWRPAAAVDGRHHPLMERYCSAAAAAAAAAAMAAKFGGDYDAVMFTGGDKASATGVAVDCVQRYRSTTSGYVNYHRQSPFVDVAGRRHRGSVVLELRRFDLLLWISTANRTTGV